MACTVEIGYVMPFVAITSSYLTSSSTRGIGMRLFLLCSTTRDYQLHDGFELYFERRSSFMDPSVLGRDGVVVAADIGVTGYVGEYGEIGVVGDEGYSDGIGLS